MCIDGMKRTPLSKQKQQPLTYYIPQRRLTSFHSRHLSLMKDQKSNDRYANNFTSIRQYQNRNSHTYFLQVAPNGNQTQLNSNQNQARKHQAKLKNLKKMAKNNHNLLKNTKSIKNENYLKKENSMRKNSYIERTSQIMKRKQSAYGGEVYNGRLKKAESTGGMKDYRFIKSGQGLQSPKDTYKLGIFMRKVQELQNQFLNAMTREDYEASVEITERLLNYTIDLNLLKQFTALLCTIGEVYLLARKTYQALFYFSEARESAQLLRQQQALISSLIGLSKAYSQNSMDEEAIRVLKKALEYAWYYEKQDFEFLIYDEIGRRYYHLGCIDKAKKYHQRYTNSIEEPLHSAHRLLSKQRIRKMEQIHLPIKYWQLDSMFLAHLKLPMRTIAELALISPDGQRTREKCQVSQKYFHYCPDLEKEAKRILNHWSFQEEMDQPMMPSDQNKPPKPKKFSQVEFKMSQFLRRYNRKALALQRQPKFEYKESIDKKVDRKLREPPAPADWYQKMVKQINRNHKNKLLHVRNQIQIRGYNQRNTPSLEACKEIYRSYYEWDQNY